MNKLHRKNCRKHTQKRLIERYGLTLKRTDIIKIKKLIDRKIHRNQQHVFYKGKEIVVVYDTNLKEIVTVLPNLESLIKTSLF